MTRRTRRTVRHPRRRTELGLLALVALITVAAYTLVSLSTRASLPANIGPFLGVLLALFLGAHLAIRRLAPHADPIMLGVAAYLNALGYVFITRLDDDLAALQATWTLLGIAAFVATLALVPRVERLAAYRWTLAAVGLILLLLPTVPGIGATINGARLWLRVAGVSIQPGEFAKLALVTFLAAYLWERREMLTLGSWRVGPLLLPDPRHLGPLVAAWGASLLVMVRLRDLGSSLLIFTLFLLLIWVATGRAGYVVLGLGLFAVGALAALQSFGHVQERVDTWIDPWADPQDSGFQLVQATFSLGEGGLTGTGPGLGDPTRIPAAETDFIFAVIGEELGLVGATTVLIAFLLLIGSGLRVAVRADNEFEKLMAVGLTATLGLQTFIIVAGVLRVMPLTGITLPFVSYGGSSLLANYVLLALLVRLSDDVEGPPARQAVTAR